MPSPDPNLPPRGTTYVLAVDDVEDILETTRLLLERPGVEVLTARSAEEALALLGRHEVALALLDVNMPRVNGFALAEAMRDNEATHETPIIFLTGGETSADRKFRGYETGAVDFLVKPVDPRVLESKVAVFVSLYRERQTLRSQKTDCERLLRANQRMAAELERARGKAVEAALTDELTGIPNRRHILQLAQSAITDPRRNSQPLCVAILDLDHFKRVNDTQGHHVGDAVLRGFCDHCRRHLREGQRLGRLGGEEFLLLLPGTPLEDACTALARVRATLAPQAGVTFTFSAGVGEARAGEPLTALIERADQALYRAKSEGRDRVATSVS
jgi:two-component system cell cycle response regulator